MKATNKQLLESYERLGNIWKVAPEFNMCGQSVWERLKKLGIEDKDKWTKEQLRILRNTYSHNTTSPLNLRKLSQIIGKSKTSISRKARGIGLVTNYNRTKDITVKLNLSLRMKERAKKHQYNHGFREIRICPICGKFFDTTHSNEAISCSANCSYQLPRRKERFSNRRGGKRADLNNIYFRSSWEANYARYLNYLIKQGNIIKWEFEPTTFPLKNGNLYTPDFRITFSTGHIEYHEVKGWDYPKGIIARQQFNHCFPHLKLILINQQ